MSKNGTSVCPAGSPRHHILIVAKRRLAEFQVGGRRDIEGGTSGGPIINESGELLGVVSHAGGEKGKPQPNVETLIVSKAHL